MNPKGKFIVIESNDEEIKLAVMEELKQRLNDFRIHYVMSKDIIYIFDCVKIVTKDLIKNTLCWKTEFMLAESVLLETIGDEESGLKSLLNRGENVIMDYYDTSICVNIVPNDEESNRIYNVINRHINTIIEPDIRILIATSKTYSPKENCNDYIDKLVRFKELYLEYSLKENCQIIHFSKVSFYPSFNKLEEIIKKMLSDN